MGMNESQLWLALGTSLFAGGSAVGILALQFRKTRRR
jgi:hypothetical protein